MPTARLDRAVWPFGLALLLAAVTRLAFPFDGLFGQDAFAYFRFARAIGPHLFHGVPLPPLFWPRGYPAAVAAFLPLTGGGPFAGQLVSALACAWAAAATFLLARELERRHGAAANSVAPIVAGLCVAASGIVLRESQVVMSDGLAMSAAATSLWSMARFLRTWRGPWLVLCSVALAIGGVTRWQVGLLAIPLAVSVAVAINGRAERPPATSAIWWAVAALAGLAVLVPQLIAAHAVPNALEKHEWLLSWSPWNAFGREFHNREAYAHYRFPVVVFYLLRLGWPDALFPSIGALAAVGGCLLVRARRGVDLALLVGWPVVNVAFISGIPYENPRFLWPALPAIGALAGIGYQLVRARLSERRRTLLALGLAVSLAAGLAFGAREHDRTVARKNVDRALVDWLDARVPPDTTLLMSGGTLMVEYYGTVRVLDIYLLGPADLPALLARTCPCMYLEDPVEIEERQAGLPPQLVFHALRRDPGLAPVATRGQQVLFRLGPPR